MYFYSFLSGMWLVNFGKTLTYNNNDSILFRKPQVSWVAVLICSMPGCSLLELLVLDIHVSRLLQLAPCKMTLLWCVSLGEPPQACSCDLSEVRGEKAQKPLVTWHSATGTTFYSHRNALHLRERKEVGSGERGSVKSHWKAHRVKKKEVWTCLCNIPGCPHPHFALETYLFSIIVFVIVPKSETLTNTQQRGQTFHINFVKQCFFSLSPSFHFHSWFLPSLSVLLVYECLLFVCNNVLKPGHLIKRRDPLSSRSEGWSAKIGKPRVFKQCWALAVRKVTVSRADGQ